MQSSEFLMDIALMYDTLQELSNLSQQLQRRGVTLPQADRLIKRTVRLLNYMCENPAEKVTDAKNAISKSKFGSVDLVSNPKVIAIPAGQLLCSLVNNLQNRLLSPNTSNTTDTLLQQLKVLDSDLWDADILPRFGESEIASLCVQFRINKQQAINGFREYVEIGGRCIPPDLKPLMTCVESISISSAECERCFSAMNNILTPLRNSTSIQHISNLLLVKVNGPPLHRWNPIPYATSWLRKHRSAVDPASRQCASNIGACNAVQKEELWKIL